MKGILAVLSVLVLLGASSAFAQDATLNRARQLIEAKQPRAAFDLLSPLEQQRAGEPDFDYLLGVAAIDSGQLTRGVFALERVLAVRPDHPQARAEIARAYYLMGENKLARDEFQAVKNTRPPAEVSATIDRFLDALDSRERARRAGIAGFVEIGAGYDTNVNAATAVGSFAIPAFGGSLFSLTAGSNPQKDDFWTLSGGVAGRAAINDTFGVVGSASIDRKMNSTFDMFDTGSINASGGVTMRSGDADEFMVAAQGQSYSVDNHRFRDAIGGVAQWRHAFSVDDQLTAYVQQTRLTYPTQSFRNADRSVLGAAWAHGFGGPQAIVMFLSGYVGKEDEMSEGVPQFGNDFFGGRLGGQMSLSEKLTLFAALSYEQREYGGPDPLFLINRTDKQSDARVTLSYAFDRNLSVNGYVAYTKNDSNIVINDYDRTIYAISLRYDFR